MDPVIKSRIICIGICIFSIVFSGLYMFFLVRISKMKFYNMFNRGFSERFSEEGKWDFFLNFCRSCTSTAGVLMGISIGFTLVAITNILQTDFLQFDQTLISIVLALMVMASTSFVHSSNLFHDVDARVQFGDKDIEQYFFRGSLLWSVGLFLMSFALLLSLVLVSMLATIIGNLFYCISFVYYFDTRFVKGAKPKPSLDETLYLKYLNKNISNGNLRFLMFNELYFPPKIVNTPEFRGKFHTCGEFYYNQEITTTKNGKE